MSKLVWFYLAVGLLWLILNAPRLEYNLEILSNINKLGLVSFQYFLVLENLVIVLSVIYIIIAFLINNISKFRDYLKGALVSATIILIFYFFSFFIQPWAQYLLGTGDFGDSTFNLDSLVLMMSGLIGAIVLILIIVNISVFKKIQRNETI